MLQAEQVLQGRYQLQKQLGNNAGRQTWLARDVQSNPTQLVTIKFLAFNPQMPWENFKLFEREAQVLKNINHPYIPRYQDYFSFEDIADSGLRWFALVQEYIPGQSLKELLESGQPFSAEKVQLIGRQILNILIKLHELSPPIIHRDLKPSNLILGKNSNIYLIDFGAVQDKAKAEGATFTVVGTSGYAPPEQLWGKAVPASDLYSLGATLIHLLTGKNPAELPQKQMQIQFREQVQVSSEFGDWIETLIQPAPERRFSSARQALEALPAGKKIIELKNQPNYGCAIVLALVGIGLISTVFSAVIIPPFLGQATKAKESEAKQYLASMNRAQQAYFMENNQFADQLEKLQLGIKEETENFRYSVMVKSQTAFNYGISKKKNLRSYVSGVFLVPDSNPKAAKGAIIPTSIICETNSKTTLKPNPPTLYNGNLFCADGTRELYRRTFN